jgi:hypothetical protein
VSEQFHLSTTLQPSGDQPQAIKALVGGLEDGLASQTLLGVTGSGKTFSIANVIQAVQRPTLILAPNKTLAAQLYGEMRELFPDNAVEYFVSYYDYYQPETYVPNIVVTFIYLSFAHILERPDGDEADVLEPHTINVHYIAAMLFFIVFGDNVVRLIESSETFYWFWLLSARGESLAVFGALSVLVLFAYWSRLGRVLKASG